MATSDFAQRVEDLLGAALDLEPTARETYLIQRCGDDAALLAEVRSLLAHHQRAYDQGLLAAHRVSTPALTGPYAAGSEGVAGTRLPATVPGYEVLRELGRGGMGVVYLARQCKADRLVALKMLLPGLADDADLARFRVEAEALARLQHASIVQIFEIGEAAGGPYFALEYCAGGSLKDRLAGGPLAPAEAARLAEVLARAAAAAHAKGVLHRDLKPANVLLAEGGVPKLTDFGLAKKLDQDSGQTRTGMVMGTPSYMAPEQARGEARLLGPACDLHALGAVLYEMLTGRPPFLGATLMETLEQVCGQEPVPPRLLNPQVPRDLEIICLKCLHKEPGRRYADAQALGDDLRRFQAGEPIHARPVGRWERGVKWVRRKPALALTGAIAGAAVVTTLVVLSVGLLLLNDSRQEALDLARDKDNLAQGEKHLRERADTEKAKALRLAGERDLERKKAVEGKKLSDLRLATLSFEQAYTRCAQGDSDGGLLALAECLRQATDIEAADLAATLRVHLTGWARNVHPMRGAIRLPEWPEWPIMFAADGRAVLALDRKNKKVFTWDLGTWQLKETALGGIL